ncbi:endosome-associated-trafficking regulator 1 isoform X2 [Mixophyes fleayi]|uniref:endosome-associated-trafficking regulator 1 isoform X2 n=1 Tax=Mixophyes fleayi TaxID=3061075 RepID=UPI003F4E0487
MVTDCEADNQDDANPFSFKEFVKSKTCSTAAGKNCDGDFNKDTKPSATLLPEPCEKPAFPLQYQDTFFKDPTISNDFLDDNDEVWSESYHPSAIEQTHNARKSPDHLYNESYGYSDISGVNHFTTWRLFGGISPSTAEPSTAALNNSTDDLRFQNLQINYEEMLEENSFLKMKIQELRELNDSQTEKVKHLERKLKEKILEEQKEAQDLESMVQQVETNLQMMTKRASKAENNVTKLKQDVTLLQIQLNTYKTENEALRRGETAGMNAVKQNASLALENLHRAVSGAQASIKQLVSGAEALNLVAELLRSIDKIAEVHEDVP